MKMQMVFFTVPLYTRLWKDWKVKVTWIIMSFPYIQSSSKVCTEITWSCSLGIVQGLG